MQGLCSRIIFEYAYICVRDREVDASKVFSLSLSLPTPSSTLGNVQINNYSPNILKSEEQPYFEERWRSRVYSPSALPAQRSSSSDRKQYPLVEEISDTPLLAIEEGERRTIGSTGGREKDESLLEHSDEMRQQDRERPFVSREAWAQERPNDMNEVQASRSDRPTKDNASAGDAIFGGDGGRPIYSSVVGDSRAKITATTPSHNSQEKYQFERPSSGHHLKRHQRSSSTSRLPAGVPAMPSSGSAPSRSENRRGAMGHTVDAASSSLRQRKGSLSSSYDNPTPTTSHTAPSYYSSNDPYTHSALSHFPSSTPTTAQANTSSYSASRTFNSPSVSSPSRNLDHVSGQYPSDDVRQRNYTEPFYSRLPGDAYSKKNRVHDYDTTFFPDDRISTGISSPSAQHSPTYSTKSTSKPARDDIFRQGNTSLSRGNPLDYVDVNHGSEKQPNYRGPINLALDDIRDPRVTPRYHSSHTTSISTAAPTTTFARDRDPSSRNYSARSRYGR